MNLLKKSMIFSIVFILGSTTILLSQNSNYHNKEIGGELALGPRVGGVAGISLKKYAINNYYAFEAVASFGLFTKDKGIRVNVLFEKIKSLSDNEKLSAIFGGGVGMRLDPGKIGAAGILGFDWRISKKINMQVDWQPTWLFFDELFGWNAGYTVRYNLNR